MGQRNPRTRAEIKQAFDIQLAAVAASSRSYDDGNRWEALRLSTAVYNLVHDHGSIKSLLGQLGIRRRVRYRASPFPYVPGNSARQTPLALLRVRLGALKVSANNCFLARDILAFPAAKRTSP
jgi:hypothetical protein